MNMALYIYAPCCIPYRIRPPTAGCEYNYTAFFNENQWQAHQKGAQIFLQIIVMSILLCKLNSSLHAGDAEEFLPFPTFV
jgi:hypothetical protein